MEKPDDDGFVKIIWPSKNIPHGGIFHTRVVEPSFERQEFIKVLLEESRLSMAQRQKCCLALRQAESKAKTAPPPREDLIRPNTSRRRSLSAIRESGVFDINPYHPFKRGEDREKLKERLAHTMTYGDSPELTQTPPPRQVKPAPELPSVKERWNDLLTQIRERVDWLAEMEDLGHADPHREIIQDQIAERLRALDALGIDGESVSARSGFSTLKSKNTSPSARSIKQKGNAPESGRTHQTVSSKAKPSRNLASHTTEPNKYKEENIAAYGQLIP